VKGAVKLELARPSRAPLSPAARRIEEGEGMQLKIRIPEAVKRAVKMRAAAEGLTIRDYILRLLEADGVK
jgi:predicted DNA binding CopG/RHH family protein